MKKLQIFLLSASLIVLCTGFSFFSSKHAIKEETTEYTHKFLPEGVLEIRNITGTITIEGWDKETIWVKTEKKAPIEEFDKLKIEITFTDTAASIETVQPKPSFSFFSWGKFEGIVDYTIKVPYKTFVKLAETISGTIKMTNLKDLPQDSRFQTTLKVTNGDIHCTNIGNALIIESTRGDVNVTNNGASLSVYVTNGDIHILQPQGAFTVKSTQGNVEVTGARHSSLITTINGNITLYQSSLPKNEKIGLKTTRGDISLCLGKNIQADLRAETIRGTINISNKANVALFIKKLESTQLQASVGDKEIQQPAVALGAINGDIKIIFSQDC